MLDVNKTKSPTKQELFDATWRHFLKQRRPAKDMQTDAGCLYRMFGDLDEHGDFVQFPTPLSCAAGCHLTDAEYDPRMDSVSAIKKLIDDSGTSIENIVKAGLWPERLKDSLDILRSLQRAHDGCAVISHEYMPDGSVSKRPLEFLDDGWITNMRGVAHEHHLDASIIDREPFIQWQPPSTSA